MGWQSYYLLITLEGWRLPPPSFYKCLKIIKKVKIKNAKSKYQSKIAIVFWCVCLKKRTMIKKICLLLLLISSHFVLFAQIPPSEKEIRYSIGDPDYDVPVAKPPRGNGSSMGTYGENQKYGLKINDTVITQPIYDKVALNSPYGFIVKKGDKYGFINRKAEETIAIKYDSIGIFDGRSLFLLIKKKNAFGVMNHKGEKILSIKYPKVLGCNKALLCVVEGKTGKFFLYQDNKKVFNHHLDRIAFYENGAIIGYNGKYGFVSDVTKTKIWYDRLTIRGFRNNIRNSNKRQFPPFHRFRNMVLDRLIVEKDKKFGMIDFSGNLIVPIENDQIYYNSRERFYVITKGKKQGAYIIQANKYLPAEFDRIRLDKNKLKVTKEGKVGIINNQTGEVIIPLKYTDIDYLDDVHRDEIRGEFYRVKNGELVGLATPEKLIIPIEFEYIYAFEGMFQVLKNDIRGLYSTEGDVIQPLIHDYILRPRTDKNAVIFTKKNGQYGILTMEGQTLYENIFKQRFSIPDTEQNLNLLRRDEKAFHEVLQHENGKYGVIDIFTGKFSLPLEYDGIYQNLHDGIKKKIYFLVSKDGKYGLVDEKNDIVIDLKYELLDIGMNKILMAKKDIANTFFVAQEGGKFGVLNLSGEVIIPFQYQAITKISTTAGLFKAKKEGNYMLINSKNEILNAEKFDDIANFEFRRISNYTTERKGIALAFSNGKMREIDENGTFLTEPVSMQPHDGFQSLTTLKIALVDALNSPNDSALYYFAEKIAPSGHLMYFFKDAESKIKNRTQYLDYQSIISRYYQKLMEFKYSTWKNEYLSFDSSNIYTEDYTVEDDGFVTNRRIDNWAYGDTRILEKILRNSLKINGYWISGYFAKSYF